MGMSVVSAQMLRAPVPAAAGAGGIGGYLLRAIWQLSTEPVVRAPVLSSPVIPCPDLVETFAIFLADHRLGGLIGLSGVGFGLGVAVGLLLGCLLGVSCGFRAGFYPHPGRAPRDPFVRDRLAGYPSR